MLRILLYSLPLAIVVMVVVVLRPPLVRSLSLRMVKEVHRQPVCGSASSASLHGPLTETVLCCCV